MCKDGDQNESPVDLAKQATLRGARGMDHYIGCKIIAARPMDYHTFLREVKNQPCGDENQHGYLVIYPDGYQSWSPEGVFERAYRKVSTEEQEMLT